MTSAARNIGCLVALTCLSVSPGRAEGAPPIPGRIVGAFEVEIPGAASDALFREVEGLSAAIEVLEYQEGGNNDKTHKLVGLTRYANIVLQPGLSLPENIEAALPDATDPNELRRLSTLRDRFLASDTYHLMLPDFDVRALAEDDLFFNDLPTRIFNESGCETFIVAVQVPSLAALDTNDPNDPKASRTLKGFFNSTTDAFGRAVPWQKHEKSAADTATFEFSNADPMQLSVELFFDGFESKESVKKAALKRTKKLNLMPFKLQKPPRLSFVWGAGLRFESILTRARVNYTMFLPDGKPLRAKVTIKLIEPRPPPPDPGG